MTPISDEERAKAEIVLQREKKFLASFNGLLSADGISEVRRYAEFNEPEEAFRLLAWLIVDEQKAISRRQYETLKSFCQGLIDESELPEGLLKLVVD